MARLLIYLLLVCSIGAQAQNSPLTAEQTTRLAQFSKLYSHIKFFHPYMGCQNIPLDSAFAASATKLIEAPDVQAQVLVLQEFLQVLNDPATTVEQQGLIQQDYLTGTANDSLQFYFNHDSILIINTNNYFGFDDFGKISEQLDSIKSMAAFAKGIVFDMRTLQPIRENVVGYWPYIFDAAEIAGHFISKPINNYSQRFRMHSGFAPENGTTSGGYYSGFYTVGGGTIKPANQRINLPVAILINDHSDVPSQAVALSMSPGCAVFISGSLPESSLIQTTTFEFSPEILVNFRVSELLAPNGAVGSGDCYVFEGTYAWDAAEKAAYDFVYGKPVSHPKSGLTKTKTDETLVASTYEKTFYPSLGYRLLAGAKIWGIIHYFFAYKELMSGDWDKMLPDHLNSLAGAKDSLEYNLAVYKMYRNIEDGHGFISSPTMGDYFGRASAPCSVKFVEGQAIVSVFRDDSIAQKAGLSIGDVVLEINGEKTEIRAQRLAALLNASNEWTRSEYVSWRLLRGKEGENITLKVRDKKNREKTVVLPLSQKYPFKSARDQLDTVRILPGNIGYVDLARLVGDDVDNMFEKLKDTRAIIFDMRGYPNGTAWSIAPRLTEKSNTAAARFMRYNPMSPDIGFRDMNSMSTTHTFVQHIPANMGKSVYKGKTVMLIDESTQSQAEHTGLFFEAANGTEFIGSPTAGANGDVTNFKIPGNISLSFSGHDVRHADGRQLQKVGLQPKVYVKPTIKGIQAGKDEVLDAAIKYLTKK
ncbi:MAG: hypothetical protein IT270_12870 [Saprospiraceae bacterium]|nr:hypothetical protein [Saprospiraceae bacterium]